ncbi:MAG TPA: fluoride efflux transporter CrcB [Gemmatimonadaceae bacterium]|nr:fluoride efflux transporter CrcB [Gemmatimonadaceae bacterium]
MNVLFVAIGSALGGVTRWLLGDWVQRAAGGAPPAVFPLGTLVINATGSFVLGVLAVALAREVPGAPPSVTRLLLAVGFCGGYTTFSTFSLDTVALLESRGWSIAALNVFASVGLGLAGVGVGLAVGRLVLGRG